MTSAQTSKHCCVELSTDPPECCVHMVMGLLREGGFIAIYSLYVSMKIYIYIYTYVCAYVFFAPETRTKVENG